LPPRHDPLKITMRSPNRYAHHIITSGLTARTGRTGRPCRRFDCARSCASRRFLRNLPWPSADQSPFVAFLFLDDFEQARGAADLVGDGQKRFAVRAVVSVNALWFAWLPLYGSAPMVAFFYTAQFLPYAVQYARAGLGAIPSSYEWAARVHGASAGKTTRRIVLPLLWPHCLGGAIDLLNCLSRVGRLGALAAAGMQTVSTFILREFDQGSPAAGLAMGMIAIAAALLSITLARRLVGRKL